MAKHDQDHLCLGKSLSHVSTVPLAVVVSLHPRQLGQQRIRGDGIAEEEAAQVLVFGVKPSCWATGKSAWNEKERKERKPFHLKEFLNWIMTHNKIPTSVTRVQFRTSEVYLIEVANATWL